jgi:UDP-glucose 4-epimerase
MDESREAILAAGGAGFFGSESVGQLGVHRAGFVVVDSSTNGQRENPNGLSGDQFRLIIGDIRESGGCRTRCGAWISCPTGRAWAC